MTIRAAGRPLLAFLLAVLATAVLASVIQTQFNLAALTALGAPVTGGLRVLTTLRDVAFFGPVMAAIAGVSLLPAFAAAGLVSRLAPSARTLVHAVAGAVGLWTAFEFMGFFTPMPTFVAAVRTEAGQFAVSAAGLIGGALFARASRRRAGPPAGMGARSVGGLPESAR